MKRTLLSALLLLPLLGSCSHAFDLPPLNIARLPRPESWPDAGAIILSDTVEFTFKTAREKLGAPHLVVIRDHSRLLRIDNERGLTAATLSYPWQPDNPLTRLAARVIKPNGERGPLLRETALRLVAQDACQAASDGLPTGALPPRLQVAIPNVAVGDYILVRTEEIFFQPHLLPPWIFAQEYPVEKAEVTLIAHSPVDLHYRYLTAGAASSKRPLWEESRNGTLRVRLREDALPALQPLPYAPHPAYRSPYVLLQARLRSAEVETPSDLALTWPSLFAPLVEDINARQLPADTPKLGLHNALAWLTGNYLHSTYGGLFKGSLRDNPLAAAPVEALTTEDALGLLLAQLRGDPQKAQLALINSPQAAPILADFPGFYAIAGAVVALQAPADRGLLLADPTCESCAPGDLTFAGLQGQSIYLTANGGGWEALPKADASASRTTTQLHARLDMKGNLTGNAQGTALGAPAHALLRAQQICPNLSLKTRPPGSKIPKAAFKIQQLPSDEQHKGKVQWDAMLQITADHNTLEALQLPLSSLLAPSYEEAWLAPRQSPALLNGPWWFDTEATLTVPVTCDLQVPEDLILSNDWLDYGLRFKKQGRKTLIRRRLVLKENFIAADAWPQIRAAAQQIAALEAQPLRCALRAHKHPDRP